MSRFFSDKYRELKAYTPGEQPKDRKLIKLNTNENPWPPEARVAESVKEAAGRLNLYSDPECGKLREILAGRLDLRPENLIMTNGSDEALNFAFMAFCDADHPAVFPDITYGFYPVYARVNQVPFREIPLTDGWRVDPRDYAGCGGTVFLANPNAPTGIALTLEQIGEILRNNPDSVVVVDEAYTDFSGQSALSLLGAWENLLVIQTFSKFRSLAGLRLGYAAGSEELIRDLKTMQYSTNPYNVDSLAQAAGVACLEQDEVNTEHARMICETREWFRGQLLDRGFEVTDSRANFLFVRRDGFPGSSLRDRLRERGILIRWFDQERIRDWSRITIGTRQDMETLIRTLDQILEG
ncbi:MAG: histidinol-phosphate transaminase [Clostridiales bacterium]|nr:histidinol-phosphate transaminase [Clostridiales bacterium]